MIAKNKLGGGSRSQIIFPPRVDAPTEAISRGVENASMSPAAPRTPTGVREYAQTAQLAYLA